MTGLGFTVMIKEDGVPLHVTPLLVYTGVTVMVPAITPDVLLVAVKLAISPEPDVPNPIAALLLDQL
jgi:hypothetical protein